MSTAIRHIFYKPDIEELSIWFAPEGRRYKYSGVPELIYHALRDAESRGRFFNQSIRGRYPSQFVPDQKSRRPLSLRKAS